ncbi:hypothetical protein [Bartonella krasnovii]|uniref:Phage related protein n=1 Tax=Bartonella krasnovii TaxID=2267275 RepID=A0A5B9D2U4_9HYPH|nr:hypothetical protein [Bartonella krasnovii]QEE12294.1 phage related protein [Bartonella krasnovii]UNF36128.1 hypothetical protein MNL12_03140 [Bartonella krasnovii]UNF37783.1 hypothetical protein MNL11_03350 [Bartonella krasnovii]UNF39502.1 hypothetical protein MNL10_03500 [Bartonella krasnovii]UNF41209.1 hypothetical protein MNL09_03655 [Bartonella krasnovii]
MNATVKKQTTPIIATVANDNIAQDFVSKDTQQTKKYELSLGAIEFGNRLFRRVIALRDFGSVKKGDVGGFIEHEGNLSHDGNCWVAGYALVFGKARVLDDAHVTGNAKIFGDTEISNKARVGGHMKIFGHSAAFGKVMVSGRARLFGNETISFGNFR